MHADELRQHAQQLGDRLRHEPSNATLLRDLGIITHHLGDTAQAIEFFRRAITLAPMDFDAHYALGSACRAIGRLQNAVEAFTAAIALRADHAAVHNNLGLALQQQGNLDEAIASFRRALELQPGDASTHSNLLLCMNYHDAFTAEAILAEHVEFAKRHEVASRPRPRRQSTGRRIRIGYLSPDFRRHSVAFFIWPILEHHDRNRVEVTCYSDVAEADPVTQILRKLPEHWRDVAVLSNDQLAQQIADDEIDIFVDLTGHTARNRLPLFAHRAAPIQVTYLGYPNTTGLSTIDFRLTDVLADPVGVSDSLHRETLMRLPGAFFCYMPPQGCPDVAPLPAMRDGHVTFGVFTNFSKVRPAMIRLWSEILSATPQATLVLQAKSMDDPATREATMRHFMDAGIASDRVDLRGWIDFPKYIALFADIDIVLDTFPFNGHTTSCHALWMGVPLVTRAEQAHRSRMGLSLLTNLGLPELIAHDDSEYVRIATELARDLPRLQQLRAGMRERMRASPILDSERFCRNLEAAYEKMLA